jgi:hypothetical protein
MFLALVREVIYIYIYNLYILLSVNYLAVTQTKNGQVFDSCLPVKDIEICCKEEVVVLTFKNPASYI